jgi:hypothetical protein
MGRRHFQHGIPVRVNLATFSSYVVSGQETVSAFLKDPAKGLSQTSRSLNIMTNAFGCPAELVHMFKAREMQMMHHRTMIHLSVHLRPGWIFVCRPQC